MLMRESASVMGSKTVLIVVLGVVAVLAGAGALYVRLSAPGSGGPPRLTPEAKAYVKYLKLGPVEMKATDSYVHQTITEFIGTINNGGSRAIESLDIYCIFYDTYGQIVLRERAAVIKASGRAFAPGETRSYRLAFDDIPQSWNNQMPQLVIAHIGFE